MTLFAKRIGLQLRPNFFFFKILSHTIKAYCNTPDTSRCILNMTNGFLQGYDARFGQILAVEMMGATRIFNVNRLS